MKSLSDANKATETSNTAASVKYRKTLEMIIKAVGGFVLLCLFLQWVWLWQNKPSINTAPPPVAQVAPAAVEAALTKTLTLPALGRSDLIRVPLDKHMDIVSGDNYRLHNMYTDGTDCTTGCKPGPLKGVVLENVVGDENLITYTFAPMR